MTGAYGGGRLVAVTGSSGFIGSHLCALLASRGVPTRAIVRRGGARRPATGQVLAELADRPALARALAGVHTVVHLAGRAHVLREPAGDAATAFREVNVDGTRRLIEAAAAAGAVRVLVLSSIGAVATTSATTVDDTTCPAPDSPYGRSKLEAEGIARAHCEAGGLGCIILRPPMVFGEGMKGNPLRLFRLVDRGIPVPVGAVHNRRSTMHVDNLAAAILSALGLPDATRDTFVVGDSPPQSSADLVQEIAAALGRPARLVPIPLTAMRRVARIGDVVGRLVPFPFTSSVVERLTGSLAVDHSRFSHVTGYTPPLSRPEAMRRTAAWFRSIR